MSVFFSLFFFVCSIGQLQRYPVMHITTACRIIQLSLTIVFFATDFIPTFKSESFNRNMNIT